MCNITSANKYTEFSKIKLIQIKRRKKHTGKLSLIVKINEHYPIGCTFHLSLRYWIIYQVQKDNNLN